MTTDAIPIPEDARRGRGATVNPTGRFEPNERSLVSDGWDPAEGPPPPCRTTVSIEHPKTVISKNSSPDLPFDQSVNAYRGCEHGCIYCYARPTHAYLNLSPGLDFESRLTVKPDAADLLKKEISKPGYICKPIALGTNTDPYQPLEKEYRVTRSIIEVLGKARHPFTITTKSDLVLRDLDLLAPLGRKRLVSVSLSVTSLDNRLSRIMEPRASAPHRRLRAISELSRAGINTIVQVAPIVPAINDHEIEAILRTAKERGAHGALYLLLRLPGEVADLFHAWLEENFPDRAPKVINLVRSMRGGKDYESTFGTRMRGTGPYAEMIERRFTLALRKTGLVKSKYDLPTQHFRPPARDENQLSLF
ncbi:radical SAM protein [Sneathiella chinensis]|uniref:Radical SAM protein n=2 Tax=Sneathiella chinensis TaxID=349750 RepID=A0ABQ5U0G8_9PROT|nr:radical SAM protein [Sneathiella chinensis]